MDPMTLAAAVISVLRPLFGKFTDAAAERAGENAADSGGTLYRAVRKRLRREPYSAAILTGAEEKPQSQARADALTSTLAEIIHDEPDFATEIADLLPQANQTMHVEESGAIAGRDVNQTGTYVAGRDMTITDS